MAREAVAGHLFCMKLSFRIDEAVEATGLGRSTLYRLISDGQLKTFKVGTRTLIMASVLTDFLESKTSPNPPSVPAS